MRSPEELREDKSVFMNQGEWELLHILSKYKSFSLDNDDYYAEMKFHVSVWNDDEDFMTENRMYVQHTCDLVCKWYSLSLSLSHARTFLPHQQWTMRVAQSFGDQSSTDFLWSP